MNKQIKFSGEAREGVLKGVEKLAKAVTATLGPSGRNVLIERIGQAPLSTKDGVTVAKEIDLIDPIENIGAQLVKQVASRTNDLAGDGTTTSTLLAAELYKRGLELLADNTDVMEFKKGMDLTSKAVIEYLEENSTNITSEEQLEQVAKISANNDETIGKLIASAIEQVGTDGIVTAEESRTGETFLETVEGMEIARGFKSPYFVTNNDLLQAELKDVLVLIVDSKINSVKPLLPLLENASQKNKSLLIIAEDVDGEALSTLVVNKMRGILKCAVIKAPGFGDRQKLLLEDIAIVTGGNVVSKEKGMKLENYDPEWLGSAKKAVIGKEKTTLIDAAGKESEIEDRVKTIKIQIENSSSNFEIENLQSRIGKIAGGVAIINVGGASEVEMREKKDRVEDALHATRAAIEEGIVPGGGVALLNAGKTLEEYFDKEGLSESAKLGVDTVYEAVVKPFECILKNAGYSEEAILDIRTKIVKESGFTWKGFNPKTDKLVDMFADGIIDPTKVTRLALENAISVVGTLLTTEAVIYTKPELRKDTQEGDVEDLAGMFAGQ